MHHPSYIELRASALKHNIKFLKQLIGPKALLSSVVKGNAYGHSLETFVPMAEVCGVSHFSVFSADEALRVVNCRTNPSGVLIMGFIDEEELAWAIQTGVAFFVFDVARLESALAVAKRVGKPALVHLEIETGLHRTGLEKEQLLKSLALLKEYPEELKFAGMCTHFAGAESIGNHVRIMQQVERFSSAVAQASALGQTPQHRHTACSAAALTYPDTIMDMVRIGIAQYGYWPSQETRMSFLLRNSENKVVVRDPLQRVLRWVSRVMHIKTVKPGEFVGYGTTYLSTRAERFAVIPVGYFHGFPRSLSNLGHVLVAGRRAPVAGMVNMNLIMVDITDLQGVQVGDEVVIIGKQRRQTITTSSFSELTKHLNYEVLTRLPAELPRIVVQ